MILSLSFFLLCSFLISIFFLFIICMICLKMLVYSPVCLYRFIIFFMCCTLSETSASGREGEGGREIKYINREVIPLHLVQRHSHYITNHNIFQVSESTSPAWKLIVIITTINLFFFNKYKYDLLHSFHFHFSIP